MSNLLFVILLSSLYGALLTWAFKALPREKWQILAAVPLVKEAAGGWRGLNLTYYGLFMATSNMLAAVMMLILLGSIGVPAIKVLALMITIFACGWAASRLIARLVEKKRHTFTIGGALFVGMVITPWVIQSINALLGETCGREIPVIPALAAAAVAYAYAEGLGRLACISFGCCYGRPVEELSPRLGRLFRSVNFVFAGATKKVAYEGHLEGRRVVPVQGLTAVAASLMALIGTYLYLKSYFVAALLLTMVSTQIWRVLSEILRADFRGRSASCSTYQVMAVAIIVYLIFIAILFETVALPADISQGLRSIWNPATLLWCQGLWLFVFLITGRSMVTGSTLTFFIHSDRI
ncbi:MAG TPA: prolipoprotein diacylglyceryl transferase family protein [Blastocatellia bacterium]|nr:prolipoprotein diacylglyceryl transferase family protein [Blastocatellia bacterium]